MAVSAEQQTSVERRITVRSVVVMTTAAVAFALLWALQWLSTAGALVGTGVTGLAVLWNALAYRRDMALARREAASTLRTRMGAYLSRPDRMNLIDGIADPLLLIGPDKQVLAANAPARELFGRRIEGRSLALHLRHPQVLEAVEEAIAFQTHTRLEISLPASTERHYAVSVARVDANQLNLPMFALDLPPFHLVITLTDVTQAKVSERMRADFVANASHELRTPLSSLIGFIETLKTVGAQDPEASARFLGIMNAEALRMVRLIDDLLSLSRIEMDRHLQPSASVALPALFESLLRSMQPQATARAVCFDVALEGDLPAARGDRDQLLQVFMNLLSNSIKYGRQGGTVRITAKQVRRIPEVGSPGLCITVSDEGDGIPSEHLPRLTERFYRVDSARSRRMGGTGLGLAIVKHIVSRHRGHLAIDSVLGQGTSVAVYLPAADPVEEGQEPTQQAQAIASAAQ